MKNTNTTLKNRLIEKVNQFNEQEAAAILTKVSTYYNGYVTARCMDKATMGETSLCLTLPKDFIRDKRLIKKLFELCAEDDLTVINDVYPDTIIIQW